MTKLIHVFLAFLLVMPLQAAHFEISGSSTNSTVVDNLRDIRDKLNSEPLIQLAGNQEKFARANADANAAAVNNGSFYSGIDARLFAVSLGLGSSMIIPRSDDYDNYADSFDDGADVSMAMALHGGFGINAMVNGDRIPFMPIDGLVLEGKVNYMNLEGQVNNILDDGHNDYSYKSLFFGMGVRYKVLQKPVNLLLFKMSSITVGSGVYYSSTRFYFEPDSFEGKEGDTTTTTRVDLTIENKSVIFPCEIATSVKLLGFLNLTAGAGVDFAYGSTSVDANSRTTVRDENLSTGSLTLTLKDAETTERPSLVRYKLIGGVGLSLGPAHLSVPFAIYPGGDEIGYTVSMLVGATF